jgi:CPA1 family monovalent cation:H+ antiporter
VLGVTAARLPRSRAPQLASPSTRLQTFAVWDVLLLRLYAAERQTVLALRNSGAISNDVMHRLERELDLEESHREV